MANEEHLAILKQGVLVWNKWREENSNVKPDLSEADLSWAILMGAYLSYVRLRGADLSGADLRGANLNEANLSKADLDMANLSGSDLSGTILSWTNFNNAAVNNASFQGAFLFNTFFCDLDLRQAKGLEAVKHLGPSSIDSHTLVRSRGQIPEAFLRGVGFDDNFISHVPTFFGGSMIQFYSCFISYSSKDEAFAKRIHADLQANNVRCWFAPEDLKIGDKIRPVIDEKIRLHDKLLIVLSKNSVNSRWVENEVESALEKEEKSGKNVLFPVRIDDAVMETDRAWAATIRRQVKVGDFCGWEHNPSYEESFERLLRDLKAEPSAEAGE